MLLLLAVVVSFSGISYAVPAATQGDGTASQEASSSPPPAEESVEPVEEAPEPETEAEEPEAEEPAVEEAPAALEPEGDEVTAVAKSSAVAGLAGSALPPATLSVAPAGIATVWDYVPPSKVTMEGYSLSRGEWFNGNLLPGYVEGEWIPFRLRIDNSTNETQAVPAADYWVDFKEAMPPGNAIAIDETAGWSYYVASVLPAATGIPAGAHSITPVQKDQVRDSDKGLVTVLPEVADFLIPPHSQGAVYFRGHLAITAYWQAQSPAYLGASGFNGSSSQARLYEWYDDSPGSIGDKSVPFCVGRDVLPDSSLRVTKCEDLDGDGSDADADPTLTTPAFTFNLQYEDDDYPFTFTLTETTVDGIATFSQLPPGEYELTEVANGDWISTNLPKKITIPRSTCVEFSARNYIPRVQLEVEKIADRSTAAPGDVINYTVRYRNAGNTAAQDVSIVDDYDESLVTPTGYAPATDDGDTLTWDIGDLSASTSWQEFTYSATVVSPLPSAREIVHNRADILLDDVSKDYAEADVTVEAVPALHITKVASVDTAMPGEAVSYTIEYWNDGSTVARNVAVVDDFADDDALLYAIIDGDGGISGPGGTLLWPIGDVAADGVHHTLTVVIAVADILPGFSNDIDNTASISLDQQVVDEASEHVDIYASSELSIDKSVLVAPSAAGDEVTYQVDYYNNGTTAATNVSVIDTYDTAYVDSVVDADGGDDSVPGTIAWDVGTVAAQSGGSVTYTVKLKDTMPTAHNDIYNTAAIYGNREWVDEDTEMVSVDAASEWTFDKVAVPSETVPGGAITYTLYYTNSGSLDAPNVAIVDDFDESLVSVVDPGTGVVFDGGSKIFFALGTVPADGVTRSVSYTVSVFGYMPELSNYIDNFAGLFMGDQLVAQDTERVSVPADTALDIDKSADKTMADPGDTITYTVTWSNTGGTTSAHNVWVADDYDQSLVDVVSTDDGTDDGNVISWYLGDVGPDETGSFTYQVTVKDVMPAVSNDVHNVAILFQGEAPVDWADWHVSVDAAPALHVAKSADTAHAATGDVVTYSIDYSNTGSTEAKDVRIVDDFSDADAGLFAITDAGGGTPSGDDSIEWLIGDLAAGASGTLVFTARVADVMPDLTNDIYNEASIYEYYENYVESDDWTVDVDAAPVLSIDKEADTSFANAGDFVTYTVSWFNDGDTAAEGVTLEDVYDTTYVESVVDADGGDASVDGVITWNLGTVDANDGGAKTYTVKLRDTMPETFNYVHNVATLHYMQESHEAYWDVFVAAYADMTYMKTADKTVAASGDEVEYTISYRNAGQGPAYGVFIVDDFADEDAGLYSILGADGGGVISGDTITWDVGDVAPDGVTHELHVTIKTTTPMPALENDIYNVADFYEDYPFLFDVALEFDGTPGIEKELVDTHDWTVEIPEMDLSIAKVAGTPTATASDEVTYTITYKNESSVPAKDFTVTDDYDQTLVDVVDAAGGVDNGDTLVWTIATELAPHATGTIVYKVQVKDPEVIPADVITPLENVATISHPDDWDETNNTADATVLVDNPTTPFTPPDLTIDKSADKTKAEPGDTVTYTLVYKNVGEGESQGFTIVDDFDERYVTVTDAGGGDTSVPGTIRWAKGILYAGESGKVTYTVKIDETMPDGATNVDNVVVIEDPTDKNPNNNGDDWRVVVGEKFLPFTGGDVSWILLVALLAGASGIALRRRATHM